MMCNKKILFTYLLSFCLTTILLLGVCATSPKGSPSPTTLSKSKPVPMRYMGKSPSVKEKLPLRMGHHTAKRYLNLRPAAMQATGTTLFANRIEPRSFFLAFTGGSALKFVNVYSTLFQSTESVDRLPPGIIKGPPLDGIIEEQIESFDVKTSPSLPETVKAEITYRFILYSPKGNKISSWTVKGVGEESKIPGDPSFHVLRAIDEAQHDAATKFIKGFSQVPAVKQLL